MSVIGLDGLISQTAKTADKSTGSVPKDSVQSTKSGPEKHLSDISEPKVHPSQESHYDKIREVKPEHAKNPSRYIQSKLLKRFMRPIRFSPRQGESISTRLKGLGKGFSTVGSLSGRG
tara:strand:- start:182 stop:535 length:354 start_codon:yes stop_codon:yes gene_type:complete